MARSSWPRILGVVSALVVTAPLFIGTEAVAEVRPTPAPTVPTQTSVRQENASHISGDEAGTRVASTRSVPNIVDPDPSNGCPIPKEGIYGCWWQKSYFRGYNFSIAAVKFKEETDCQFGDLGAFGWANRISSMANWTRSPHYYYAKTNLKGRRVTLPANTSRATLGKSDDNNFESVKLRCYAQ